MIGDPLAIAAARQRFALIALAGAALWLALAQRATRAAHDRARQQRLHLADANRACETMREQLAGVATGRFIVTPDGTVIDAVAWRERMDREHKREPAELHEPGLEADEPGRPE